MRYCLWGTIHVLGKHLTVTVELVDTSDGGIVWADRFSGAIDDVHQMREDIRSRVLVSLEISIPIHEAAGARLAVPEDLDAWSAYHLGLQHVYRFNRHDNAAAASLFQRAVSLDPCFARAHAGLSFVHFQTAFMHYTDDVAGEVNRARRCAERGLELDPLDPFVNFTMGRTFWVEGDLDSSLGWLERATRISPNYAQGIYAQAWTETLAGRAQPGRRNVDLAMRLSPIDPLYYAMLATRGFTHMAVGEDAEAAEWADRAARSPGAHVLIAMIAAVAQSLKGDDQRAAAWAGNVRERNPALNRDDFFRAFPMKSEPMRARTSARTGATGFMSSIAIRMATEADLEAVAEMVDDCATGHPSKSHPRPLSRLREAYFGAQPVAHLLVACRDGRVVGMGQWTRMYDMFWAMFFGYVEWLYVRPETRGLGIPAAIVAEICRQVRLAGGEFIRGGAESTTNAALYERVAAGWAARTINVGGEAFQVFADLGGLPVRDIVRRLPKPELNSIAAQLR